MPLYLIKVLLLFVFSAFVGYNYYFLSGGHITNFDGYLAYAISVIFIYGIYKYLQHAFKGSDYKISLVTIISVFLANLFVLCFYFFSITGDDATNGFILFFKILWYSILPIGIFVVSTAFGRFLTKKIEGKKELFHSEYWLLDLGIGFVSLITLLTIFGIFNFYSVWAFFIVIISFILLSHKEFFSIFKELWEIEFKIPKDDLWQAKLVLKEFFYLIAFIVLGVGLISVVRPYPIGWDDLGVYMNFPHLMAENSSLLSLGGMYSWQVFTGIGYMFDSPTLAFFLNFSSIVLSFLVLNLVLSNLLSIEKERKTFLDLPIIFSTIFIGLPMVGFHTKDMKLDEGYFFISVIVLFLLYRFYLSVKAGKDFSNWYLFLIGIIAGFSFGVKFTALLLIVGVIGIISFARLGIIGFLGYVSIFLGFFTLFDFWKMMNVVVNPNNIAGFENSFGMGALVIGLFCLIYYVFENRKKFVVYLKELSIFLIGVIVILLPWFGKNISEIAPNYSISGIISGKSEQFEVDYTKLYSQEEYEEITNRKTEERKKENLITTNEDMLRYFGYEKGILDYVNMFWNLTMQKNQAGEYTNIGFLFLALLPLIFVFLPFKRKYYFLAFVFIALIQFLFYATPNSKFIDSSSLTGFDSKVLEGVIKKNENVFQDRKFNKDVYDIKISDENWLYLFETLGKDPAIIEEAKRLASNSGSLNYDKYLTGVVDSLIQSELDSIVNTFYNDLIEKVKNTELGADMNNFPPLTSSNFDYIKYLNRLYSKNNIFISYDIVSFKELLNEKGISETDKNNLISLWNNTRTFSGKIVDLLASINIPLGYVYLFLGFLFPTLFLLLTIKNTDENYLFNLNLVFAFLYVFLWLISSFGIVWYGITMYFSFFLMISIGAVHILSYKGSSDENYKNYKHNASFIAPYKVLDREKLIGTLAFLSIILSYVFFSLFPYIFSNLKTASYNDFKKGIVTQAEAVFVHQPDYKTMIFTLNIDENKREEFFKENIDESIYNNYIAGKGFSIEQIFDLFAYLEKAYLELKDINNVAKIKASKENLYKGMINPKPEFKNTGVVYRIGTFLLYYISENDKRVFGDSLLFPFDDYIYSDNVSYTIDRLKILGFKHLLIDLNSATIDSSITHDLTNRYENLLKTLTSDKLELVSTDSLCLELALELYRKGNDMDQYLTIAGVNYDGYDEDGNQISRTSKKVACLNYVGSLLEQDLVNEDNFVYLLPYKEYFKTHDLTLEELNRIIPTSYRALFNIK